MYVNSYVSPVLLRRAGAPSRKEWIGATSVLCAVLAAWSGSAGAEVPVPPDLSSGDKYRLVFATNPRAIGEYEEFLDVLGFVNSEAEAAGIGKSAGIGWAPIISWGGTWFNGGPWIARDRVRIGTNTPVYNLDLQRVASGFNDFWDGTHEASIPTPVPGPARTVWTGSNFDGTPAEGLTLGSPTVRIGQSYQLDEKWIASGTSPTSPSSRNSYYAISEELTVPFAINAGLNDAWYDPEAPGKGVFITVLPGIEKVFLAWLTYDIERPSSDVLALMGDPGHRWLTALGGYSGRTATLDVVLTSGGRFEAGPKPTYTRGYGTITLDFSDCETLFMLYDLPSLDLIGGISLTRLVTDNVALCEELNRQPAGD